MGTRGARGGSRFPGGMSSSRPATCMEYHEKLSGMLAGSPQLKVDGSVVIDMLRESAVTHPDQVQPTDVFGETVDAVRLNSHGSDPLLQGDGSVLARALARNSLLAPLLPSTLAVMMLDARCGVQQLEVLLQAGSVLNRHRCAVASPLLGVAWRGDQVALVFEHMKNSLADITQGKSSGPEWDALRRVHVMELTLEKFGVLEKEGIILPGAAGSIRFNQGRPFICNLGQAAVLEKEGGAFKPTKVDKICGTPGNMAPEARITGMVDQRYATYGLSNTLMGLLVGPGLLQFPVVLGSVREGFVDKHLWGKGHINLLPSFARLSLSLPDEFGELLAFVLAVGGAPYPGARPPLDVLRRSCRLVEMGLHSLQMARDSVPWVHHTSVDRVLPFIKLVYQGSLIKLVALELLPFLSEDEQLALLSLWQRVMRQLRAAAQDVDSALRRTNLRWINLDPGSWSDFWDVACYAVVGKRDKGDLGTAVKWLRELLQDEKRTHQDLQDEVTSALEDEEGSSQRRIVSPPEFEEATGQSNSTPYPCTHIHFITSMFTAVNWADDQRTLEELIGAQTGTVVEALLKKGIAGFLPMGTVNTCGGGAEAEGGGSAAPQAGSRSAKEMAVEAVLAAADPRFRSKVLPEFLPLVDKASAVFQAYQSCPLVVVAAVAPQLDLDGIKGLLTSVGWPEKGADSVLDLKSTTPAGFQEGRTPQVSTRSTRAKRRAEQERPKAGEARTPQAGDPLALLVTLVAHSLCSLQLRWAAGIHDCLPREPAGLAEDAEKAMRAVLSECEVMSAAALLATLHAGLASGQAFMSLRQAGTAPATSKR